MRRGAPRRRKCVGLRRGVWHGDLIVRIVRIMPYGWRAVCSATDGIWLFLATKRRSPTWFILILIFGVVYFWYFLIPRIGHSMKERWYLNLAAQACHKGRLHSIFIKWPWLCVQGLYPVGMGWEVLCFLKEILTAGSRWVFEKIQESKNLWFWVLEKLESNTRWFWVFENNAESTDCLFPVISKYLKTCQVLVLQSFKT